MTRLNKSQFFSCIKICIILVVSYCNTKAQPISFEKVGLKEGLSQVSVLSIHKDQLNRMWFGTRNGLNCWDGETMNTYYPNEQDGLMNSSFAMNDIIQIGDMLWLNSNRNQLIKFNMKTYEFSPTHYDDIMSIEQYDNKLYACTRQEMLIFEEASDSFITYPIEDTLLHAYTIMYNDKNGNLWIYDRKNKLIKKTNGNTIKNITLPKNLIINDLMLDSKNRLWIASQYNGIYIYNEDDESIDFINKESEPYSLKSNTVRSIKQDRRGRIWIGTFMGVSMIDDMQKICVHNTSSNYHTIGLSNNSVHSLYISDDDNIWVGTYYGGVNYGRIFNPIYTNHYLSPDKGINFNAIIGDMVEDNAGNLWIGTEGDGLYFYNIKDKTFTHYPQSEKNNGPSQTNIKALHLTKDHLLIGTYRGGLNILNLKTRQFKHYNNVIKNLISIKPYKDKYLLGTHQGVFLFDIKTEQFTQLLTPEELTTKDNNVIIRDLLIDEKGILWIGTAKDGLIQYNTKTKRQKKYIASTNNPYSISSNAISFLFEDQNSQIWIGTIGGGLNRYQCKTDNFKVYNKKNNKLQDDYICSIIQSRLNNIWVATSSGLSILDEKDEVFYNYGTKSGFPIEELNTKALLQTSSGNVFVGGIGGLVSFKESNLLLTKNHFTVILSELEVNNKKVQPNDETGILSSDIANTASFILQPEHSSFKISFSACNYNPRLRSNYQYQLEGFNDTWINARFSTYANYTNLNPGKYTFKVRAVDMANNPISETTTLSIKVIPPPYQRWYAYVLYLIIITILILIFNYIYLDKMSLSYQLKNEKKENERIKELNLYKLRFFTNISHEFMTPLTIMLSSLENVLSNNKLNTKVREQLQKVNFNAKRLKNLNRELLDFRRIEQGFLTLNISKNDIVSYVKQCFEAFEEMARIKNITYSIESDSKQASLWFDPVQMDKVFYNLLSNAFNHADTQQGNIQIEIHNKTNEIRIEVTNNGKGIPKDEINKIFNRFFQSTPNKEHNEYYGSGIGLALSQSIINAHHGKIWCESNPDHFTTFSVSLKKGNEHFDASQISDTSNYSSFTFEKDLIEDYPNINTANQSEKQLSTEAPKLLIVDDNKEIREILKGIFSKRFHILLAEDGSEGLKTAIDQQPDVIISDIKMPQMSGLEMCQKLKRNISTSHIPIALITALSSEEDKTQAFNCGANSFISKPFKTETLLARIESMLKNKNLMQNKFASASAHTNVELSSNRDDKVFLDKALDVIEKNKNNSDFSITDFAKAMNMSRTLFFERIKVITGLTPNDFLQTTRLKKAAELLNNDPNKNVSQVAYELGFNSPQYFSRCFKQHFGVSPSKYGKQKSP